MDTKQFVVNLGNIPNKDVYKKANYTDNLISKLLRCYIVREKKTGYKKHENPILELIDNYFVEDINICFTSFSNNYEIRMPFIYFGYFDADILAINTQNNEVVLLDSQNKSDFIMCSCANNSSSFLDILIDAANFNEKKSIDTNLDKEEFFLEKLNILIKLAGGDKYLPFCKLLIGYES